VRRREFVTLLRTKRCLMPGKSLLYPLTDPKRFDILITHANDPARRMP